MPRKMVSIRLDTALIKRIEDMSKVTGLSKTKIIERGADSAVSAFEKRGTLPKRARGSF